MKDKLNVPQKVKKPLLRQWWFWTAIVIVAIIAISNSGKDKTVDNTAGVTQAPQAVSVTTEPVQVKLTGINADKFDTMVREKIVSINKDNVVGKIETRLNSASGNIAYVDLYLTSTSFWSAVDDTGRKEFINNMGQLMDGIALVNRYDTTKTISTGTTIYSPSGLKLGERTVFGNIKLE